MNSKIAIAALVSIAVIGVAGAAYSLKENTIDGVQLEQLEQDIERGMESIIKIYSRESYDVDVSQCVIIINTDITNVCRYIGEHTKEVMTIHLPEFKKITSFSSKNGNSLFFHFSDGVAKKINEAVRIYDSNRVKMPRRRSGGSVTTPTAYQFNLAGKKSQKYLKDNNVLSSRILYSCTGISNNEVRWNKLIVFFKDGAVTEVQTLLDKINAYKEHCGN